MTPGGDGTSARKLRRCAGHVGRAPLASGCREPYHLSDQLRGSGASLMTFSIVGFLPETWELGIAVSTARPAVGNRVPFVRFGLGAAATQASPNPMLGVRALDLLEQIGSVE